MTSKKRSSCDSANVRRHFCPYFQGVFPDFQGFCEDFHGFCLDFQELCPDFWQIKTFRGALAPPPPTPLDFPISLNLLFNFSKQASTAVASNFHKSYYTFHLFRFLFHDAIFTTRASRLLHLNKIVTSVTLQMAWLLVIFCYFLRNRYFCTPKIVNS